MEEETEDRNETDKQAALRSAEQLWVEADGLAPREQCVSRANPGHPQWNEDRVLCSPAQGIVAVFDGMGGYAGGEAAARAACGTLALLLPSLPGAEDAAGCSQWLVHALEESKEAVHASRELHPDAREQNCTATVVVLVEDKVLAANMGDSRAYRYRGGVLVDLTSPTGNAAGDEETQQLRCRLDEVETRGELDGNSRLADLFAQRNIVPQVLAYVPGGFRSAIRVEEHSREKGDVLVVCSDGVHDNLTNTEIRATIEESIGEGAAVVVAALASRAWLRSQEDHVRAKPDDISVACLIV